MFPGGVVETFLICRAARSPQRNATLNAFKFLRNVYVSYVAKPVLDRTFDRLLRKTPVRSIVQVGLGELSRTKRLLELAAEATPLDQLKFAGIDLFEMRTQPNTGVGLKMAHKELKPFCGKLQLLPGDAYGALARSANGLANTDLMVISADQDAVSLAKAWFYVPRMLHDASVVLLEEPASKSGESEFRQLTRLEIEQFAAAASKQMRRAA